MTRETATQLLPIITAFAEGKTIQKNVDQRGWIDLSFPLFDGSPESYRIKPEPREFWVNQYDDDGFGRLFKSEIQAKKCACIKKTYHLREAIEGDK